MLTLYDHIRPKTAEQRTILYSNTVIGTLAVDGLAVTFGSWYSQEGVRRAWTRPVPSSPYQM